MASVWSLFEPLLGLTQVSTSIRQTTGIGDLSTIVTSDGNTVQITGGTRSDQGSGTNLFHSFEQFNVGPGVTANFVNTTPSLQTNNILSRVTDGTPSSIYGTIDTQSYSKANLFLMNPAGIVLGPDATLNVSGSVAFTTADYLRLTDANGSNAGTFHANAEATTILTSASVAAFGFLGKNPAAISVQGTEKSELRVGSRQSIFLVGGGQGFTHTDPTTGNSTSVPGGVTITSSETLAPGGQINIASLGSRGEILAGTLASVPNINNQTFDTLSPVQIAQRSNIDITGEGAGSIRIRGGQLVINNSTISANAGAISLDATSIQITDSSQITSEATNVSDAGHISLNASGAILLDSSLVASAAGSGSRLAGNVSLATSQGNVRFTNGSFITTQANNTGGGAGTIVIDAKRGDVQIENGAQILNFTEGGQLGSILITAGNLRMDQAAILENNFSVQPAGNIAIKLTGDLSMIGGSVIQTGTPAQAGAANLFISARDVLITDKSSLFTGTTGSGTGGAINIAVRSLTVENSGKLSAESSGTVSTATGGSINVTATNHVTLINGASMTASTSGPGNAGNILVKANDIAVSGGSTTTASSTGTGNAGTVTIQGLQSSAHSLLIDGVNSGIFTRTSNTGTGGDIALSADSLRILNHGSISGETSGTAATAIGGKIRVEGNTIRIENGALMTSSSTGAGSGGNIKLTAGQSVSIFDGASISASSTGPGAAGNIEINAGKQFDVERGSVTTQSNQLNGGNITILASDLVRVIDGTISTSALNGSGNGGNITIDPKVVLLQSSEILAQAKDGNGGSISIATPLYLKDQSSLVSADSQFGVNGTVTIQSPISNLSGTVGQLVSKTSPPQVLLQNRCIALAGGEESTFLLAGRDTLPGDPSGWLSSPVSMEHWTGEETGHASRLMVRNRELNSSPVMTAQTSQSPVLSLRRLTPPGFLVRTFATGVTGCPS